MAEFVKVTDINMNEEIKYNCDHASHIILKNSDLIRVDAIKEIMNLTEEDKCLFPEIESNEIRLQRKASLSEMFAELEIKTTVKNKSQALHDSYDSSWIEDFELKMLDSDNEESLAIENADSVINNDELHENRLTCDDEYLKNSVQASTSAFNKGTSRHRSIQENVSFNQPTAHTENQFDNMRHNTLVESENDKTDDIMVNVMDLIKKLLYSRVILERLPDRKLKLADSKDEEVLVVEINKVPVTPEMFYYACTKCKLTTSKNRKDSKCKKCGTPFIYRCAKCSLDVETYYGIQRHIKQVCFSKSEHKCNKCSYGSKSSNHFIRHLRNRHPEVKIHKIYKCDLCNSKDLTLAKFKTHHFNCKGKILLKRNTELDTSDDDVLHKEHKLEEEQKLGRQLCLKCDKEYRSEKEHAKFCGKTSFYWCKQCSFSTNYGKHLKQHIKYVHGCV